MSSTERDRTADQQPDESGEDTEGHNMWINPGSARDISRTRNAEIERQVRDRQRQKEAQQKR